MRPSRRPGTNGRPHSKHGRGSSSTRRAALSSATYSGRCSRQRRAATAGTAQSAQKRRSGVTCACWSAPGRSIGLLSAVRRRVAGLQVVAQLGVRDGGVAITGRFAAISGHLAHVRDRHGQCDDTTLVQPLKLGLLARGQPSLAQQTFAAVDVVLLLALLQPSPPRQRRVQLRCLPVCTVKLPQRVLPRVFGDGTIGAGRPRVRLAGDG
jgi:hypothetical protein